MAIIMREQYRQKDLLKFILLFFKYYYKARQLALKKTHPELDESQIILVNRFLFQTNSLNKFLKRIST